MSNNLWLNFCALTWIYLSLIEKLTRESLANAIIISLLAPLRFNHLFIRW
jgi:phage gp46-like protein